MLCPIELLPSGRREAYREGPYPSDYERMFVGVKSKRTRWSGDTIADCLRALERELSYEEVEAR